MSSAVDQGAGDVGIVHEVLVYDSDERYANVLVPYLREGIAAGQGVVVAVTDQRWTALAAGLGADADAVVFVPSEQVYTSPIGAIAAYDQVLRDLRSKGYPSVRAIGEVIYGDTKAEQQRWLRYEPAAHRAFEDAPLHVVCPYDQRVVPASVIQHARRTHPIARSRRAADPNPAFADPVTVVRSLDPLPPIVEDEAPTVWLKVTSLPTARQTSERLAVAALGADRAQEAVLAIGEVLANGVRHGSGSIWLSVWARAGHMVARVHNEGPAIDDPLAGFSPPAEGPESGMGLWLTRRLADDVRIDDEPDGPSVTLLFRA